ncbi:STAS domain-containing protein [Actinokineospora sp. HUAS TT18]|uniref:STAS domain-containing protein n=1 Tax=Actinokineospora sp. HUAS TT18 TaxID=3447451 RepID=UPI003F51B467
MTRSAIVVSAMGRIDLLSEGPWRAQVEDACAEETLKTLVVLDLSRVTYLSVGTAPLLLRAHYHCLHRGRRLRVAVPPGPVLGTMQLTGLADSLQLFRDVDSALRPAVLSSW